ncbi:MAG: PAS domain S-box protein [Candidatus Binatia bacterium]|jgi:PAS domain S-box-containing protein
MPSNANEELCQRIVAESQDAIIFADREGVIRLWNSGAEAMFGYRAGEAIGQTLEVIIPERLRQRHWDGWRKVMATGVTRYGREVLAVAAARRDGTRISIEFTIVVLRDESGKLLGVAATIRDVTTRWQQEKDQKQRLADLEAGLKRLGQEVA